MARLHAAVAAAQAAQRQWGVPSSVTLAQWIIESSWGASELALKAHNYFGVKAEHLENASTYIEFPTGEYIAGKKVMVRADFERYYDAADSFEEHARLLAGASRYRLAMMARGNPDKFALSLQKAGYSTSPTYAAQLMQLMREHDLYQYDTLPPAPVAAVQEAAA